LMAFQYLGNSLAAGKRLFEIVDAEPTITTPASESATTDYTLAFNHLSFRYNPAEPLALADVTFTLPPGQHIALVGPSGAGKSTLVNLLLRFWDVEPGQIHLGGRDIRDFDPEYIRSRIAVVSQNTYLFNTTIRENLLIGWRGATDEEMIQAAQQAQIHDFILSLPDGYDTWVGEHGLRLSGGQRQRIAIARALLKNAPILILDEATANLDAVTEHEVLNAIKALMQGRTTLMITHRLTGLETMDTILVLQNGQIVERGIHADLLASAGLYRQMWEHQRRSL
ncbi:MAG TPA: ATP-binding cassette domain-containing protein, partial [Phototrophicaceae bacterium]|nr:ATP-binding cassette domain-containing protein [Phototrophicaceae bacterium]